MIYYSPTPATGGDSQHNLELKDLSPDELVQRIGELESELESTRRRHKAEMRRGTETGERAHAGSPESQGGVHYVPTHKAEDGYDVVTHQRVAILIDVQNMYYAARNLYNSKLEFSRLLETLVRGRRLIRAISYIVERPGMEQEKFVEVLRRNGYEVRKKMLIERSDGSQKGDWDLGMALDAIALSDKVDVVVLVTGDGDFVTLVHFLHTRGIRVEVASFPETTALELIRSCDHYHRLNEKVLLPSGQFAASDSKEEPDREGNGRGRDAPKEDTRVSHSGPRPGRSPV
ncbi:MAG: NYN domain-containing protein, partial [Planctomycetota bacterium]